MTKTMTTPYDVADYLRTPEEIAAYLEVCFEEANGDTAFIAKAFADVARAKGIHQLAEAIGLPSEHLAQSLSGEHSLDFDTVLKLMRALGLKLHAEMIA